MSSSARDFPERWWPCGHGHIVLRRTRHAVRVSKRSAIVDLVCLKAIEEKDILAAVEIQLSRQDLPPIAPASSQIGQDPG